MQFTYETFKVQAAEHHAIAERRRIEKSRKQENSTKNKSRRRS